MTIEPFGTGFSHSLTHSLSTHSLTHSLTHSTLTHSLYPHSLTHSLTHSPDFDDYAPDELEDLMDGVEILEVVEVLLEVTAAAFLTVGHL